jgi:hypothetical protein
MIAKYTEKFKKAIDSSRIKAKPEPWLHIAIFASNNNTGGSIYAIYVWDTRQVIESGYLSYSISEITKNTKSVIEIPKDNHEQLKHNHKEPAVSVSNRLYKPSKNR